VPKKYADVRPTINDYNINPETVYHIWLSNLQRAFNWLTLEQANLHQHHALAEPSRPQRGLLKPPNVMAYPDDP
jgi:hypothetical protein